MAITIEKYPPKMALAGNGIVFKLKTNNMYSTAGAVCISFLLRVGAIAVDETILIEWGDKSVTFTAKAIPDASGTQITAGGSVAQHAIEFAQNYELSTDFRISTIQNAIVCQAREEGAEYDIVYTLGTTAYVISLVLGQHGISPVMRDNFRMIVQTVSSNVIKGTDKIVPDLIGEALVNVANYIEPLISVAFEFPQTNVESLIIRNSARPALQIRYAEAFGNPLAVQALQTSEIYYALPGKLAEDKLRLYYQYDESFWSRMSVSMNFLSWAPTRKMISVATPEKLYFPVWYAPTVVTNISLKLYFTDGTTDTVAAYKSLSLSQYDVVEIQCGYYGLDLAAYMAAQYPTKQLSGYELWLSHNSTPVSETRRFDMDYRYRPWQRIFIFKNSLGVYEAFRSTGKATRKISLSREIAAIDEPVEFTPDHRSEKQVMHTADQIYEVNSGYFKDLSSVRWAIDEFLGSDEVYEVRGSELLPVIFESNDAESDTDGDSRFYFKFIYRVTGNGNVITADDSDPYTIGEYNDDFANDYLN